jgi:hypothetical protein
LKSRISCKPPVRLSADARETLGESLVKPGNPILRETRGQLFDGLAVDRFTHFRVSFDWFLPNGIGSSESSLRCGALSRPTRILGSGRYRLARAAARVARIPDGKPKRGGGVRASIFQPAPEARLVPDTGRDLRRLRAKRQWSLTAPSEAAVEPDGSYLVRCARVAGKSRSGCPRSGASAEGVTDGDVWESRIASEP